MTAKHRRKEVQKRTQAWHAAYEACGSAGSSVEDYSAQLQHATCRMSRRRHLGAGVSVHRAAAGVCCGSEAAILTGTLTSGSAAASLPNLLVSTNTAEDSECSRMYSIAFSPSES